MRGLGFFRHSMPLLGTYSLSLPSALSLPTQYSVGLRTALKRVLPWLILMRG